MAGTSWPSSLLPPPITSGLGSKSLSEALGTRVFGITKILKPQASAGAIFPSGEDAPQGLADYPGWAVSPQTCFCLEWELSKDREQSSL